MRFQLEQDSNSLFFPFTGIDSETDKYALGQVRDRWNAEALDALDRERAKAEIHYLPHAIEAAKALLAYARARAL